MSAKTKILTGAAGLAALVGMAAPAAAQYYPPQPGYGYGYGYQNGGDSILGAIGRAFGYGRYPYGNYGYDNYSNQSMAVDQCARAVESRLNGYNGYYGYGNGQGGYGNYGYNRNDYQRYGGGRVLGITRVERKSYGLHVYGVASSGYRGYEGYNRRGYGTYGYDQGADLSFDCKVQYSGRVRQVDINRRNAYWRGY